MGRGLDVKAYDLLYRGDLRGSAAEGDVGFFVRMAARIGGPVLELGCGTGRVTFPLARAGFKVTGLDVSMGMLEIARRKAGVLPPRARPRFVRGDMASFRVRGRFRFVFVPFRAFQHLLDPESQKACLKAIRRHLVRGGRLVVDLFDPWLEYCGPGRMKPIMPRRVAFDPVTGHSLLVRTGGKLNDPLTQTFREKWTFYLRDRRGKLLDRSSCEVRLRWTYRWEMRHLLELCGFRPIACHGDFRGGPPVYGREQVWVAEAR